jgi:hypothetical protein
VTACCRGRECATLACARQNLARWTGLLPIEQCSVRKSGHGCDTAANQVPGASGASVGLNIGLATLFGPTTSVTPRRCCEDDQRRVRCFDALKNEERETNCKSAPLITPLSGTAVRHRAVREALQASDRATRKTNACTTKPVGKHAEKWNSV